MKCERIDLFLRDSISTPGILLSPSQATVQLVRKKKVPLKCAYNFTPSVDAGCKIISGVKSTRKL